MVTMPVDVYTQGVARLSKESRICNNVLHKATEIRIARSETLHDTPSVEAAAFDRSSGTMLAIDEMNKGSEVTEVKRFQKLKAFEEVLNDEARHTSLTSMDLKHMTSLALENITDLHKAMRVYEEEAAYAPALDSTSNGEGNGS